MFFAFSKFFITKYTKKPNVFSLRTKNSFKKQESNNSYFAINSIEFHIKRKKKLKKAKRHYYWVSNFPKDVTYINFEEVCASLSNRVRKVFIP